MELRYSRNSYIQKSLLSFILFGNLLSLLEFVSKGGGGDAIVFVETKLEFCGNARLLISRIVARCPNPRIVPVVVGLDRDLRTDTVIQHQMQAVVMDGQASTGLGMVHRDLVPGRTRALHPFQLSVHLFHSHQFRKRRVQRGR